jgi:hypothetical protein
MKAWYEIKTFEEFKEEFMGRIIYEPYCPTRVGKIIEVINTHGKFNVTNINVKIKWLKQTKKFPEKETIQRAYHLKDLQNLIDDHLKKYNNHLKTLIQAKKL